MENTSFRKMEFGESKATSVCVWIARKLSYSSISSDAGL